MTANNSMRKLFLITFMLSVVSLAAYSQNVRTSTIEWKSTKSTNQVDQATNDYTCSFTTHGDQSMDWNQSSISTYTITGVEGSWANVAVDGQITYHISSGTLSGDLLISRVSGVLALRLT